MELTVLNVEWLIATAAAVYTRPVSNPKEYAVCRADAVRAAVAYGVPQLIKAANDLPEPPLPAWAHAMKYEYDLGMATACERCDAQLKEGTIAYRDTESSANLARAGYPSIRSDWYCSVACVLAAEGGAV